MTAVQTAGRVLYQFGDSRRNRIIITINYSSKISKSFVLPRHSSLSCFNSPAPPVAHLWLVSCRVLLIGASDSGALEDNDLRNRAISEVRKALILMHLDALFVESWETFLSSCWKAYSSKLKLDYQQLCLPIVLIPMPIRPAQTTRTGAGMRTTCLSENCTAWMYLFITEYIQPTGECPF